MDLLTGLNPAQMEAVKHTEGPLLIVAGAGSGKTKVLTTRIAYLIKGKKVTPWSILAITFTNKAAGEMKDRVGRLIGAGSQDIWVSTFHSACLRILRRDITALGYDKNFVIYDTDDQLTVIKDCLKQLNIDDKKFQPRAMAAGISDAKNQMMNPAEYSKKAYDYYSQKIAEVYSLYQYKLQKNNALDFDDLIRLTVQLFDEHPDILEHYQNRFKYIMVDEYQDTNHTQYRLVYLLAQKFNNLCVVGDPDQSIYGWRGADIQNILDFEKDYPQAKVIKLEENYRSTQTILDAANSVITNNMARKDKSLFTQKKLGSPIVHFVGESEYEEALYISNRIRKIREKENKEHKEFAVLYRTNAQSRSVEEGFIKFGIPYKIVGGLRFYERKEIKDVFAYLKVLANPWDEVSLKRVINVPKRGVGDASVAKLIGFAVDAGISPYEALFRVVEVPGVSGKAQKGILDFGNLLADLRQKVDKCKVTEILEEVLLRSGYQASLEAEKTVEAETRLENIKELRSVTGEFDKNNEPGNLVEFLSGIALVADIDNYEEQEDAVVLMTLHSAKGLEFPVVFLVGMEDGIFPHSRALFEEKEMEEERRICYVGITRAEEKLYLTQVWRRTLFGKTQYRNASRFIEEVPKNLISKQDPLDIVDLVEGANTGGKSSSFSGGNSNSNFANKLGSNSGISNNSAKVAGNNSPVGGSISVGAFNIGDKVQHAKWGVGVIVALEGNADDCQLKIAFPEQGIKQLDARYAPIKKCM